MEELSPEEQIVFNAIIAARDVQEYIWGGATLSADETFNKETWGYVFQKRVDKILEIDFTQKSARVELRKRVLQQATLSIAAMELLDRTEHE